MGGTRWARSLPFQFMPLMGTDLRSQKPPFALVRSLFHCARVYLSAAARSMCQQLCCLCDCVYDVLLTKP